MDAWSRYTPGFDATAQHPRFELESGEDGALVTSDVADDNSVETGQFELDVADVADKTHGSGVEPHSGVAEDTIGEPMTELKI